MAFAQTAARPIVGAVATVGVSDRVAFLRKTYGLLGFALIAFAVGTAAFMRFATAASLRYTAWFYDYQPDVPHHVPGMWHAMIVGGLFIGVCMVSQRLAHAETSRAVQYLGLAGGIVAYSALLQPVLWGLITGFGNPAMLSSGVLLSGQATAILGQSIVITLAIFLGLTLTVFVTRKDFSFLRGALMLGVFAMIGVAFASWMFGFTVGVLYFGAGALLMSGFILYQTSLVMSAFRPTAYVAAALMLFSSVVTLFLYVLQIVMSVSDRR
jgi:FtsH-binding integral membrane protein